MNINVTGPGATVALGLMFLKTNNTYVNNYFLLDRTVFIKAKVKNHSEQFRNSS